MAFCSKNGDSALKINQGRKEHNYVRLVTKVSWCPIQTSKHRVSKGIGYKIKWDWDNFTDIFSTYNHALIATITVSSVKQFALFCYHSYNLSNIYMRSTFKGLIVDIKKYK